MKNTTRYILITIIIILMLLIAGSYTYCMVKTYAEEPEQNEPIYNFNQIVNLNAQASSPNVVYFNNGTAYLTGSDSQWYQFNSYSITSGHKYFCYQKHDLNYTIECRFDGSNISYYNTTILTANTTGDYTFYAKGRDGLTYNGVALNAYIIDLTQMFGSEIADTLTVDYCRYYFPLDYYPYNTGSPITFSGIEQYNNALNDIFSNYTYSLNMSALTTTTRPYDFESITGSDFGYNNTNWYILGAVAIPLFTTLNAGANFNITYNFYAPNIPYNYYKICIGKLNDDGSVTELASKTYYDTGTEDTITLTLPIDVSTIILYARYNSNSALTDVNFIVYKLDLSATQLDVASAILSSFNSGANYVYSLYEKGSANYETIYMTGYYKGQSDGNAALTAMDYVKAAFVNIGDILTIEVFPNFPLGAFFLLPIMTSLIFFVIKMAKGGS